MRKEVLWRKTSRIIIMLATELDIEPQRALKLFYQTQTCRQLNDERYGLHLMSDRYVLANLIQEFRHGVLNSAN